MIRLLLIITACILFTGCGMFRKSKRIDKVKESSEVVKISEVKSDQTGIRIDKSRTDETSKEQSDSRTTVYPTPGKPVTVSPDGTVSGEIDSVTNNVKRNTDQARQIVNDVKESLQKKVDSIGVAGEKVAKETYNLDQEKKPSFFGTIGMWMGVGLLAIAVIWAVAKFWFRR